MVDDGLRGALHADAGRMNGHVTYQSTDAAGTDGLIDKHRHCHDSVVVVFRCWALHDAATGSRGACHVDTRDCVWVNCYWCAGRCSDHCSGLSLRGRQTDLRRPGGALGGAGGSTWFLGFPADSVDFLRDDATVPRDSISDDTVADDTPVTRHRGDNRSAVYLDLS